MQHQLPREPLQQRSEHLVVEPHSRAVVEVVAQAAEICFDGAISGELHVPVLDDGALPDAQHAIPTRRSHTGKPGDGNDLRAQEGSCSFRRAGRSEIGAHPDSGILHRHQHPRAGHGVWIGENCARM